jgi:GT2 family glycosyltransferase
MINVCIPIIKRYDLLRDLLESLRLSTSPCEVWIIDNGHNEDGIHMAAYGYMASLKVHRPTRPLGIAESWNWFLKNVPEERIITNDDVTFAPRSLEKMSQCPADIVIAEGLGFACFLIRDTCVQKIGYFDEEISPGYGYYEDEDYLQRLDGRGTKPPAAIMTNVDAGVKHYKSATLKASSHEELLEHHRRFKIAQKNYADKWGVTF